MHQPADIGHKLLRFRTGQHHTEVECVKETGLGDPAPVLDQLTVHDSYLSGGPAKADKPQLEPEPERLLQGIGEGLTFSSASVSDSVLFIMAGPHFKRR